MSEPLESTRDDWREVLIRELMGRAVVRGPIRLASGQISDFYIDARMVSLWSGAVAAIGEGFYRIAQRHRVDALGGPETGAIALVTAAVYRCALAGRTMEGFFVRRKPKEHGTQKRIEGNLRPGMRAAILEDVITTGGSVVDAIEAVRQAGVTIACVACILDRLQGGGERITALGIPFEPLVTVADLGLA
ncbi:MAG: orotate phosphoribosyltransferase [Gemmataceae bacterium]